MTTTVALLTEWIERQFPVGESTASYLAVTGEPYVIVSLTVNPPKHPGIAEEGTARELGFEEEDACMGAASAFREYAEGKTGVLYWRIKPELIWDKSFGRRHRCMIYMRLLISEKPPIPKES